MKTCLLFLTVVFASAGIGVPQERTSTTEPRVVTVGSVGEIDSKAKSVTLILASSVTVQPPAEDPKTHGRGGNDGREKGKQGNTTGGRIAAPTLKKYKVMISSATVLKEGDKTIRFEDLKLGDALQVMSANSSSKLDAIEITRMPRNAPSSR